MLAHLAPLTSLTTLDLEGAAITAEGLGRLASLSALRHLYLGNTAITDEGLAALAALPRLATLDLAMCDRLTAAAIPHLAALPHLRALNVADTRLAGADLAGLPQNGLEVGS